jgi:signal recognition particle subunit SRP54
VLKIVRDEMVALFGVAAGGLQNTSKSPRVVTLLGLQGSGKTTTAGKLGRWLVRQGRHPLLVSTDVRRPAAIEQLNVLGAKAELRVHDPKDERDPVKRASGAVSEARHLGFDVVIVDTAGRLHIDDDLMGELEGINASVEPVDRLYVADAMTGQDAIKSAGEFNRRIGVTGVVLTKLDGDARGGAALSMGPFEQLLGMLPGMGNLKQLAQEKPDEKQLSRVEAIIDSMTLAERRNHQIINGSRRKRIARGSGTKVEDVNRLLKQFVQMRKFLKSMGGMAGLGKNRRRALHMLASRTN